MKPCPELMVLLLIPHLFLFGPFSSVLIAAECRIQLSMINHNRYAYQTDEECDWFHSEPWGNWGVSSNLGSKQDGDQFQGWLPQDGHLQWNSCSVNYVHPDLDCRVLNFPAPGVNYPYPADGYPFSDSYAWDDGVPPYGTATCVDQYSPNGYNVYGGAEISYSVPGPVDSNCDGIADAGGCLALNGQTVTIQNNFMSVYELDDPDADDLIQSLYFPDVSVTLNCNVDACWAVGDSNYDGWLDDIDNPASPAYQWPTLYQNDWGLISSPTDPGVPAKRIDATIRIGHVLGSYDGPPAVSNEDPALSSGISLNPGPPYQVGQTITAQFSIVKHGCTAITFDLLTLGGRDPGQAVADFTYHPNVVLNSNGSYTYQGVLTLSKVGIYHFFVAYRTPDGVWHSNVPTEGGATNALDLTVSAASTGIISALPSACTLAVGSSTCTSTISWSTQNVNAAEVWVQDVGAGASESPFAGGTSGSSSAPWVQGPPHQYLFTLYNTSFGRRIQLAQVTVTANSAAANSASGLSIYPSSWFPIGQVILALGLLYLRPRSLPKAHRRSQWRLIWALSLMALCILALAEESYGASKISGRVIDLETGKPLSAEIAIAGKGKGNIFLRHVRASEQGEFEIGSLTAGDLHLTTKLEGFAAEHLSLSLADEETRQVEFFLKRGITVRGVVSDSAGDPIPGATVSVSYAEETPEHGAIRAVYPWEKGEFKTGSLGEFEVKNIYPAKQFIIEVSHPDFLSAVSEPKKIKSEEPAVMLRLTLSKGIRVIGEVRDEDGAIVQDAQVRFIEPKTGPAPVRFTGFELAKVGKLDAITGIRGTFAFNQVKQAKMLLIVTHPKYGPFRKTIDLRECQGACSIKVVLKRRA